MILFQMMMYKQAEFEDEENSSIGSVALNSEGISTSATHIRYNSVGSLISSRGKAKEFQESKVFVHSCFKSEGFGSSVDRYSQIKYIT